MSGGPDLELQAAIIAALNADGTLQSLIGNPPRIYQQAPADGAWTLAYVTIGESQRLPERAECVNGSEIFETLHVFSRGKGYVEAKRIGDAIEDVLEDASLTLSTHRCVLIEAAGSRYFTEPDNRTRHGVLTIRALTDPTE